MERDDIEWRAMALALSARLQSARAEMTNAETALVVAIERTKKAREMCLSISGAIEAVAKMVQK